MDFYQLDDLSIYHVLSYLDLKTLCLSFSLTCKTFYKYTTSVRFWYDKLMNDFPYEECFQKFDLKKDWKSLYKEYKIPINGYYSHSGSFLFVLYEGSATTSYLYHLYEINIKNEIIVYGGTEKENVIFGFRRGNIFVFSQIFESYFVCGICNKLNEKWSSYGAWYSITYNMGGLFCSYELKDSNITNEDLDLDNILDVYGSGKKQLEELIQEEDENDYGFSDGKYTCSFTLDPSKKEYWVFIRGK